MCTGAEKNKLKYLENKTCKEKKKRKRKEEEEGRRRKEKKEEEEERRGEGEEEDDQGVPMTSVNVLVYALRIFLYTYKTHTSKDWITFF